MSDLITVIVTCKENIDLFQKTLDSIFSQSFNNLLVKVVCQKDLKDKISENRKVHSYIYAEKIACSLNRLLDELDTKYVMFINEGDCFENKDFLLSQYNVMIEKISQSLRQNIDEDVVRLWKLEPEIKTTGIVVPKMFCSCKLLPEIKEDSFSNSFINGIYSIDVDKNYFALTTSLAGCLIKSELLSDIRFSENIKFEYELDFILRLISKNKCYTANEGAVYYYFSPKENQYLFHVPAHYSEWYIPSIKDFVLPLIQELKEGQLPSYIQNFLIYYITCRFLSNLDNRNKKLIDESNKEEFISLIKDILMKIDDYYVLNQDRLNYLSANPMLLITYLILKYGEENLSFDYKDTIDEDGNADILVEFNGYYISRLTKHRFSIGTMNYFDGKLMLDGSLIQVFRFCDLKFYAQFENERVLVEDTDAFSLTKYFGIPTYRRSTYHLEFKLNKDKDIQRLSFYALYNGKKYPLKISFSNHWSKLSKVPRYSYWRFNQYFCHHADNAIVIKKAKGLRVLKREIQFQLNLVKIHSRYSLQALVIRWIYWITHPYFKNKKIWLMLDKLYKGGDSCEYLYRFSYHKNDGINKYYLINEDTKDYQKLKQDGFKPVKNGSLLHKLVFMNADLVLITNSHLFPFNGYSKTTSKYIKGLCNFTSMCLQHGLTVQKCAMAQRRIIDNTTGYFLASKHEYNNLMHHAYGYKGFDYLHMTGIGRYDGLINNDKKQILLSPTWRMYNALPVLTSEGEQRGYNPDFKNTTYFHVYNNLINNEKFIEKATETGYKIIFLLHPILSSQVNDFTPNEKVQVVPSVGDLCYEKILTESSLMVTDYSGVQFDFAYMRKPVVYFHPEELPPHYDDGVFFYDTMGFGEICTKTNQLVDLLCEYMDESCKMKEKYVQRANDFFEFDDHNNCQRIYDKICMYQKQIDIDKQKR